MSIYLIQKFFSNTEQSQANLMTVYNDSVAHAAIVFSPTSTFVPVTG